MEKAPKSKPAALADWTYLYIKEKILNLEIKPGDQINIEEFAERLEVSRTPIREAFLRLANEGLIDVRPRVGYFVMEITEEDIRELFEIREMIEMKITRRVVDSLSDEELKGMRNLLEECQKAVNKGDLNNFVPNEILFHGMLQNHIENKRLSSILDSMNDLTYRVRVLSLQSIENIELTLIEHQKVLDALIERDGDLAAKNMGDHLSKVCERIILLLKKK